MAEKYTRTKNMLKLHFKSVFPHNPKNLLSLSLYFISKGNMLSIAVIIRETSFVCVYYTAKIPNPANTKKLGTPYHKREKMQGVHDGSTDCDEEWYWCHHNMSYLIFHPMIANGNFWDRRVRPQTVYR
mmetsp:Transcript_35719/g.83074  ORF Transcript_35719/g.83074 Transcript_35719/m.83074 type:complete len:128 (-) Transcript_35719:494-877(-)